MLTPPALECQPVSPNLTLSYYLTRGNTASFWVIKSIDANRLIPLKPVLQPVFKR